MKKAKLIPIILALLILTPLVKALTLSDIENSPYKTEIQELVNKGVIHGYDDGTYKPTKEINRAEFLKIVIESAYPKQAQGENCFSDVKTDWYAKYVCFAKSKGIIQGYPDGKFRPGRTVNYVEALKMLYLTNADAGKTELVSQAWYQPYLSDANDNNIILQVPLDHLMTRGEIAKLVSMYMNKKVWGSTNDNGSSTNDNGGSTNDNGDSTNDNEGSTNDNGNSNTMTIGGIGVNMNECNSMTVPAGATILNPGTDVLYNAVLSANAGDTIVLHGGTYKENHEIKVTEPNITIMSYPGEWAVIDRSNDTLSDGNSGIWFYVDADGGKLLCTEVKGGFYAVSTETKWDWGEADKMGTTNLLIKNNKLHSSGHDVVKIKPNSDDVTVEQNEIYDSGKAYEGQDDCNAEGVDNVNADRLIIRSNYIHDICSTGAYFKGGSIGGIMENNYIKDVGEMGLALGFDTSPEYFDLSVNPEMYESIDAIARNNLIENTGLAGIAIVASKNSQVYNNTVINGNSKGLQSALFFNIAEQDWSDEGKRPPNKNPNIHDNIIMQTSDSPIVSIRHFEDLNVDGLEGPATMENNCYYQEGKEAVFEDGREVVDYGGGWTEAWSGNLSEWQTHMSTDTTSVEENPMLDASHEAQSEHCKGKGYKHS